MTKLLPLLLLYISGNFRPVETTVITNCFSPEITVTTSFPILYLLAYTDNTDVTLCTGNNCKPMGVETVYFSEGTPKEEYVTEKKNIVIVKKYKSKDKIITKTTRIKKIKKTLK